MLHSVYVHLMCFYTYETEIVRVCVFYFFQFVMRQK